MDGGRGKETVRSGARFVWVLEDFIFTPERGRKRCRREREMKGYLGVDSAQVRVLREVKGGGASKEHHFII